MILVFNFNVYINRWAYSSISMVVTLRRCCGYRKHCRYTRFQLVNRRSMFLSYFCSCKCSSKQTWQNSSYFITFTLHNVYLNMAATTLNLTVGGCTHVYRTTTCIIGSRCRKWCEVMCKYVTCNNYSSATSWAIPRKVEPLIEETTFEFRFQIYYSISSDP